MRDAAHEKRLDHLYRYQRHIYDATRKHYLVGRDTLIAGLLPPERGRVLEIGCGTGRNLVEAARRYPQTRVFGIDLSRRMLETAKHNVCRVGLEDRTRLAHADATAFDAGTLFGVDHFDRVFFSYALSMMPAWREALAHAAGLLEPGGSLHVVDFGDGRLLPRAANAALKTWLGWFDVTPRAGLEAELRNLAAARAAPVFVTPILRTYAVYGVLGPKLS